MHLPPWTIQIALAFGTAGLACLIWGFINNRQNAVRLGHCVVALHMLFYFFGSGGHWLIGLGAVSFAAAGFVYPSGYHTYRGMAWLLLALPPGLAYVYAMGLFALFLLSGGM